MPSNKNTVRGRVDARRPVAVQPAPKPAARPSGRAQPKPASARAPAAPDRGRVAAAPIRGGARRAPPNLRAVAEVRARARPVARRSPQIADRPAAQYAAGYGARAEGGAVRSSTAVLGRAAVASGERASADKREDRVLQRGGWKPRHSKRGVKLSAAAESLAMTIAAPFDHTGGSRLPTEFSPPSVAYTTSSKNITAEPQGATGYIAGWCAFPARLFVNWDSWYDLVTLLGTPTPIDSKANDPIYTPRENPAEEASRRRILGRMITDGTNPVFDPSKPLAVGTVTGGWADNIMASGVYASTAAGSALSLDMSIQDFVSALSAWTDVPGFGQGISGQIGSPVTSIDLCLGTAGARQVVYSIRWRYNGSEGDARKGSIAVIRFPPGYNAVNYAYPADGSTVEKALQWPTTSIYELSEDWQEIVETVQLEEQSEFTSAFNVDKSTVDDSVSPWTLEPFKNDGGPAWVYPTYIPAGMAVGRLPFLVVAYDLEANVASAASASFQVEVVAHCEAIGTEIPGTVVRYPDVAGMTGVQKFGEAVSGAVAHAADAERQVTFDGIVDSVGEALAGASRFVSAAAGTIEDVAAIGAMLA